MELLDQIIITSESGNATIELLHGDLSAIPVEHAAGILIVSAYPNSYVPLQGILYKQQTINDKQIPYSFAIKSTSCTFVGNHTTISPLPLCAHA